MSSQPVIKSLTLDKVSFSLGSCEVNKEEQLRAQPLSQLGDPGQIIQSTEALVSSFVRKKKVKTLK